MANNVQMWVFMAFNSFIKRWFDLKETKKTFVA